MSAKTTFENRHSLVLRLQRRPRLSFGLMIGCLVLSLGLSLVWNGGETVKHSWSLRPRKAAHQGYDRVMSNVQSLSAIVQLQEEVNELMAQPELSPEDSLRLLGMCQRLEQLNKQLIPIKK